MPKTLRFADEIGERYGKLSIVRVGKVLQRLGDSGGNVRLPHLLTSFLLFSE